MAEKKPLFDKSMDELREAFVRSRFAEPQVFGRADIEEWLAQQREAPEIHRGADLATLWVGFDYAISERTCKVLEQYGYSQPVDPAARVPDWATRLYGSALNVLTALDSNRCRLYGCYKHGVIVVCDEGDRICRFALYRDRLKAVGAEEVAHAVHFAWNYGGPGMEEARRLICDSFERTIAKERTKAEADFNRACAVSADGRKICHADKVVVFGKGETGTATDLLFPSSAFSGQRIRLEPVDCSLGEAFRDYWSNPDQLMEWALTYRLSDPVGHSIVWYRQNTAYTRARPPKQLLLCCKDGRILFVHRDQCPDPLPEGGEELTV